MAKWLVYPPGFKRGELVSEFSKKGKEYVIVRWTQYPSYTYRGEQQFHEKTFLRADCRIEKIPSRFRRWLTKRIKQWRNI